MAMTPIVCAVPIARHPDRSVFDLHMACGHVLVTEAGGPDRDNPMRGWQAMCWQCGREETAGQPDLFCVAA
jgi:hypothetical protein